MIRKLLATTAVAALLATSAYAQENNTTNDATATQPTAPAQEGAAATSGQVQMQGHLASNIIGETVYNGTGDEAENIGEVNDLVVSNEGQIQSIIVGVGGFLGLGERDVALDFAQAQWTERDGDRWLVVPMSKEQLEAMAEFDRSAYEPAPAAVAGNDAATGEGTDTMAAAPATTTTTAAPADQQTAEGTGQATGSMPADDQQAAQNGQATGTDTTATAAIDRTQLTEVNTGDLRVEDLVGTTVYGANDETVGEIGDVILTADGKVDAYLIDVGGFLGIGEKEVAVGADNLTFMQDANGNRYLYTDFTREQLDAQTAYDEGSYATNRDQQRLSTSQ